ncbi:hypothetical protein KIN20_013922 [Parelaphostrongylus tenuis]|uniref:Uncharacterized protein n=1 Tax=Parelaphostrongylus tenuis TaxID=148309 RepID=A0AAD5QMZ5_PARTN|nr:hypothetical protein KIN20_013922 [Parelaphostrongylus tenuis]
MHVPLSENITEWTMFYTRLLLAVSADYIVVMEQKFASIGRSANLNSTLSTIQDEDSSDA